MRLIADRITRWVLVFLLVFLPGIVVWMPLLTSRKVRVRGRRNLLGLQKTNVLFVSNHPSYLETCLIPFAIAWPQVVWLPCTAPWQSADRHNIGMHKPWLHFIFSHLYCVPVDRRGGVSGLAMRSLLQILPKGRILMFPEGGRTGKAEERARENPKGRAFLCRTENGIPIGYPKPGAGVLIEGCNPIIVPIFIRGTAEVMPLGSGVKDVLRNILCTRKYAEIVIGKPYTADSNIRDMDISDREKQLRFAAEALGRVAGLDTPRKEHSKKFSQQAA